MIEIQYLNDGVYVYYSDKANKISRAEAYNSSNSSARAVLKFFFHFSSISKQLQHRA